MGIFISVPKTIECAVIAVLLATAMLLSSAKLLGILQSCTYSNRKLSEWMRKKYNLTLGRHLLLALCCGLSSAVLALVFSFAGQWASIISLAAFAIFFVLYINADTKLSLRSPATLTPRFMRLMAAVWLVNAILAYLAVTLLNFADYLWGNALFSDLKYVALAVFPLLIAPIVCLSNLVIKIYEVPRNAKYVKDAAKKLAAAHPIVVGITGSYGKTSTKIILSRMLAKKYSVLSTPRSHNTPLGISKTINDCPDLSACDVFVAEMGARHVGDIAALCKLCPPDYSIITGICPQHLESFGSLENIVKGKGEILQSTKSCAFIAADCFERFAGSPCKIVACDCVGNVRPDCDGTTFTLALGDRTADVRTRLLGAHAAYNIGLCAQCASAMGVSFEDICAAIAELDYIEHRLQLIKSNGVNIIDDGFNANIVGAAAALEVLKSFGGKKTVVTPGLVELGILDHEENAALGAKLVGFDRVILVGDTLVGYIREGYLGAGGDPEKLTVVPTLFKAEELLSGNLKKGDTVLFLNDLPDVYK